jgi:hypothetical protein
MRLTSAYNRRYWFGAKERPLLARIFTWFF